MGAEDARSLSSTKARKLLQRKHILKKTKKRKKRQNQLKEIWKHLIEVNSTISLSQNMH